MPVLTGADLRAARNGGSLKKPAKPIEIPVEAEDEVAVEKSSASTDGWRMHHPDDPSHSMDCTIEVDAVTVQIKRGVALVDEKTALELERRGWIRGAKVEDYDN
jgi:hypothetical protein